jgi:hypothetical protein
MSERDLIERLEKLERDNRRLKGLALAPLVLATALATIYATQPVSPVIEAHMFIVVDDSGRKRMTLSENLIMLYDAQGKPRAMMSLDPWGAAIVLSDAEGKASALLNVTPEGQPSITLGDRQGFEMDLGSTKTVVPVTGAVEQTSAASIVMFRNDKEHHVIWRAQ